MSVSNNARAGILIRTVMLLVATIAAISFSRVAFAGVNVEGELTHKVSLQPGDRYDGVLVLSNRSDQASEVKLEQTDYLFFADGRNSFGKPGELQRSNADWIGFDRNRVILPPRQSVSVSYTIQIPQDQQLRGTYWSILMVEPSVTPPSLDEGSDGESEDEVKVGLTQVFRYAVQFVTHVGEGGQYQLRFIDRRIEKKNDKLLFVLDMENTGEHWLVPDVWAEIFDANGAFVGRFTTYRKRLYPGTSVRHQFDLTHVPPGQYKALVVADNRDDHVFGAQYTLDLHPQSE